MLHELGQVLAAFVRVLPDPGDDTLVDFLLGRDGDGVTGDQTGDLLEKHSMTQRSQLQLNKGTEMSKIKSCLTLFWLH